MASYVLSREGSVPYEDIPSKEEQKDSKVREGLKLGALLIVGLLALGVMLIYLDFVLVPLVFSRFLLYCFQPFVNVLIGKKPCPFCHVRLRWPRWLAVTTVLLLLVVIFVLFGLIVAVTISDIIEKSDFYVEQLNQLMERIVVLGEQWGYTREQVLGLIPEINFAKYGMLVLQYLVNVIPQMVLVLLIMIYMLVGYDGSNKSKLRSKIDFQIRTYILIHSLISVGTGIGAWLVLVIFKVDLALFWGLMNFILNYIPNVGSVLGVILPLPFVVLKEGFELWELAAVAIGLTLVQFVLGQVLEPKILGNAMDIPPITVICALLFWAAIWGIIGAILSVPLTVAIKLYLENFDHPAAKLLAGIIVGDFRHFDTSKPREHNEDKEKDKDLELGVAPAADLHFHYQADDTTTTVQRKTTASASTITKQ